jgi:hypothetical protein
MLPDITYMLYERTVAPRRIWTDRRIGRKLGFTGYSIGKWPIPTTTALPTEIETVAHGPRSDQSGMPMVATLTMLSKADISRQERYRFCALR